MEIPAEVGASENAAELAATLVSGASVSPLLDPSSVSYSSLVGLYTGHYWDVSLRDVENERVSHLFARRLPRRIAASHCNRHRRGAQ